MKTDRQTVPKKLYDKNLPAQSIYFEYMKRAHQLFVDRINEEESYKLMGDMDINTDVIKQCVKETFMGSDFTINDNLVLKAAAEDWSALGSQLYPQMVINGMTFNGRMTPDNVFEAICASFKVEPRQCHRF